MSVTDEIAGLAWSSTGIGLAWAFLVAVVVVITAFFSYDAESKYKLKVNVSIDEIKKLGNIAVVLVCLALFILYALSWMSLVTTSNMLPRERYIFTLRIGKTVDDLPGMTTSCTVAAADAGVCSFFPRWIWYILLFTIFGMLYSFVFQFTYLPGAMTIIGWAGLGFTLAYGTLDSRSAVWQTTFAFACIAVIWTSVWSILSLLDVFNAYRKGSTREFTVKNTKTGVDKTVKQHSNPYYASGSLAIATVVAFLIQCGYVIVYALDPSSWNVWNISDEAGVLFALDIVLFIAVPTALILIWFFLSPSEISWSKTKDKDEPEGRYREVASHKNKEHYLPLKNNQ